MARGRPKSIARLVADQTGLSLRTVQRVLSAPRPTTADDASVERLTVSMRNCATFCRQNPWSVVRNLTISGERAERLQRDVGVIEQWLSDVRSDG